MIIGIDLSLTSTGVCRMWDNGKDVKTEAIKPDPWLLIYSRQEVIMRGLQLYMNDQVVIEDFAGFISSSFGKIAALHGLVRFMAYKKTGLVPILVSPTTLKKWIAGSGGAKKEDVKLAIYKKYGMEFKTDDEADAFALADFGWHLLSMPPRRKLLKWEEEMLSNFLKTKKAK